MKNKIIQIIYEMRLQPVIAWVTILGTALSIFLILIVVMMQNVSLVNIAPESHRDRMLYGMFIHVQEKDNESNNSSSGLSYSYAKRIYDGLDGIEEISFTSQWLSPYDVKGTTNVIFAANTRQCDANFWKVFDHTLISGRYFTKAEADAGARVALLSETTARRLFASLDVINKQFTWNHKTYTVIGIVKDTSLLASMACGDVFIPVNTASDGIFGDISANMLVKDGVDFDYIRQQVKKRYAEIDTELANKNEQTVYHEAPFDQATIAAGVRGSNTTPDNTTTDMLRWIILAILLIVPAINLSSMLHSRMRHRISEIGIRRAYGCTRARIISDIINENMIVTIVGGIIGLIAAIIFAITYDGIFEVDGSSARPALGMILNVQILLTTFVACLILNIISAAIPAWQASRINPVEAINSNHK